MNSIIEKLTDKRILIFGYGREGKSTEEYIKKHIKVKSLDVFEGKREDIDEDMYDYIIKSPGIVMLESNPKYTSQTELFLDEFGAYTVGITGTKGKSTTSSMLAHVINSCGKKAILLGNIGKPCFDMIDDITEDTWIVFELSCHQLLHINKAPHIAVFLNLFEEHLDYYGTMENYFGAKANIISHQTTGDLAYTGTNVPDIESDSKRIVISGPLREYNLSILGEHNKINAEFVYQIARHILVDIKRNGGASYVSQEMSEEAIERAIVSGIESFKGLPHRLEFFAKKNGISFYDDSISTIPEACINAIKSVPDAATVIVGGMDRGIDYDILEDFIKATPEILFILCYATGERISAELGFSYESESIIPENLENFMSTSYISNPAERHSEKLPSNVMLTSKLDYALEIAMKNTSEGKACILSPAAPSYGYFKNFEERGEYFKKLVEEF